MDRALLTIGHAAHPPVMLLREFEGASMAQVDSVDGNLSIPPVVTFIRSG